MQRAPNTLKVRIDKRRFLRHTSTRCHNRFDAKFPISSEM
jgi:hypothetical protein